MGLGDTGMQFSKCATINDPRVCWSAESVKPVALGSSWLLQVERQPSQTDGSCGTIVPGAARL